MRAMSALRFVLFGAVGFGIGGYISRAGLLIPVGSAIGGASLGLALKDLRKTAILTLLGALGLSLGVYAVLPLASFMNYASGPMGVVVGVVVGVSLGLAFLDWRRIVALTLAGSAGFGVGLFVGDYLAVNVAEVNSIVIAGAIGGTSLVAALGYLENCKPAEERRPRVR